MSVTRYWLHGHGLDYLPDPLLVEEGQHLLDFDVVEDALDRPVADRMRKRGQARVERMGIHLLPEADDRPIGFDRDAMPPGSRLTEARPS